MTRNRVAVAALVCTVVIPRAANADEGQWMPEQIGQLRDELRERGLAIEPEALWSDEAPGLMRAVVNLSGCSAGFVSEKGLVATNHHCAYRAIQSNSSVEHDYLQDGFVAPTLADELDSKGTTVKVLMAVTDVTEKVHAAAENLADPVVRARAIALAEKKIVQACEEEDPANRCRVAMFYNGSLFQLHRYVEFPDVRLVYAPPSAIGNFGGEVDNWMWPRHTGDFSLMRVYATKDGKPAPYSTDNVPYAPARWLTPSAEGVGPGDFVAVLGYPGTTERYLPTVEVRRQLEQFLPARVDLYGEWIAIMEAAGERDPAVKIKVAAKLKSLANRHKNARGMLDGIVRNGILERRIGEEQKLAKWAAEQGDRYAGVLEGLQSLSDERRRTFDRDFLVDNLQNGAVSLALAIDLVRRAREVNKPDLERADDYMDRNRDELWKKQEGRLRDYDPAVDRALLEVLLARVEKLPDDLRFTDTRIADIAGIVGKQKVMDPAFVRATFDAADRTALESSRDPLIVLARELVTAIEAREHGKDREAGLMHELGPKYFEMLRAVRGGAVYPDANSTLRLSYAQVQGYSPRDGLLATPQTVVQGLLAKDTGADPFEVPERLRDAAKDAAQTYWADPQLGDVPVCFLSNGDTTGGNSGSPVIDAHGRWVGLNFDRVWENIAGDFGYSPERSRNIVVDVRYMLWNLDRIANAEALLNELGVAELRNAPARAGSEHNEPAPAGSDVAGPRPGTSEPRSRAASAEASCRCRSDAPRSDLGFLVWLAVALVRRRPRAILN